jgi:hypothetical protein
MPQYGKFFKDILSNKHKLKDHEIVMLTEEISAILEKKLPPKLKDSRSFIITCTIGNSFFEKSLCDLGVGVNLIPFSVFNKLGLNKPKPTTISL